MNQTSYNILGESKKCQNENNTKSLRKKQCGATLGSHCQWEAEEVKLTVKENDRFDLITELWNSN